MDARLRALERYARQTGDEHALARAQRMRERLQGHELVRCERVGFQGTLAIAFRNRGPGDVALAFYTADDEPSAAWRAAYVPVPGCGAGCYWERLEAGRDREFIDERAGQAWIVGLEGPGRWTVEVSRVDRGRMHGERSWEELRAALGTERAFVVRSDGPGE